MSAAPSDFDAIRALAVAYCDAIHNSKPEVFEDMCHEKFSMTAIAPDGSADFWDKAAYLARVGGRDPFPGEPSFGIYDLDVAAGEMARVHLWVDVPPRRFEDHLGFIKVNGAWKLMTKVFRTASGPEREG